MPRDRDRYRKYLPGNEKRINKAQKEQKLNAMRGSIMKFITNTNTNSATINNGEKSQSVACEVNKNFA